MQPGALQPLPRLSFGPLPKVLGDCSSTSPWLCSGVACSSALSWASSRRRAWPRFCLRPGSGCLFSSAWLQPPAGLACGDSREALSAHAGAARSELAARGNPQERLRGATRRSRALDLLGSGLRYHEKVRGPFKTLLSHKLLTSEGAAVCTCMQHARHQNRLYIRTPLNPKPKP